MNTRIKETAVQKLLNKVTKEDYSFNEDFNAIITDKCEGYEKGKAGLKSFLEDMQKGGCISGIIGDFIYHSDCKEFYIKHIDDIEVYKEDMEISLGEPIKNRNGIVHYTFAVWLCFEEYCYNIYSQIFDN